MDVDTEGFGLSLMPATVSKLLVEKMLRCTKLNALPKSNYAGLHLHKIPRRKCAAVNIAEHYL